jgi:hypothetical protein
MRPDASSVAVLEITAIIRAPQTNANTRNLLFFMEPPENFD